MPNDNLQERLEHLFGGSQGSPQGQATVSGLTPITSGWENEVYALTLHRAGSAGEEQEDLILRLYPGADAAEKSAWEREVMESLHAAGFPVPRILEGSPAPDVLGKPYVLMERIEGRSLGAVFEGALEAEKPGLVTLFCQIFVQLHTLDWGAVDPKLARHGEGDTAASVLRYLVRWENVAASIGTAEMSGFRRTLDWLKEHLPGVPPRPLCLTHGDYHPNNVLVRRDGAAFVIDWGNAAVADHRFDLAWMLLLTGTYGDPTVRPTLLREYERLWGEPVPGLEYFDALAAMRRLFGILFSLRQGAEKMGMKPGSEAVMRKSARHLGEVYRIFRGVTGLTLSEIDAMLASFEREGDPPP